ncbi:stage II sporulation protein E [Clostridium sp.]|uniref:stage II sporulation protein E n=1 Tax=Clostridium sp. TaxID=1506 RepID=UPI0035229A75
MDYGIEVPSYRRVDNEKEKKKLNFENGIFTLIVTLASGTMLSRVGFGFVEGLYLAPFGIGYLLSVAKKNDVRSLFLVFATVLIGYLTGGSKNIDIILYISLATVILLCKFVCNALNKDFKNRIAFSTIIIISLAVGLLMGEQSLEINLVFSLVKGIVIIPVFYMINYAIVCMQEINTNYFYSTEELISIAILSCLVIAGIGNFVIFGVEIRTIIALAMVITTAYAAGSNSGAILGVTMGIIIGIANNDLLVATTVYGICGLIVGVFKETGKIFSVLAYLISLFMILTYTGDITVQSVIEVVVAAVIMILIPQKTIKEILRELNNEEKSKIISDAQVEGIKLEFVDRLESLRGSLNAVATSIESLSGNEKLLMKNKGTAMIESLADRVCQECEMNNKCWGRELHSTFSDFGELMLSCESKKIYLPKDLNLKCVKRSTLLKSAEELFSTYTVNEALKSRLIEGRSVVANQINNMSTTVASILGDFNNNVNSCLEIDKLLRKTLVKNKIRYNNIYSYTDRKGRLKIKIKIDSYDGENYCRKSIIPVISELVRTPLSIAEDGCKINPETDECSVTIEEAYKYNVSSYVSFNVKDGEKYSGDSYSFGQNKVGEYVTIVSDGMGSGPEAGLESEAAIELIEKFMEGGFSEATMLNAVNSIMGMKFNEDEKFTTLDMNSIDLYTGEIEFIKVGASMSFIKKGDEVEVINSSSLPFGILDDINIIPIKKKVKQGDIIVTISDGVIDVDKGNIGDYSWIVDYLKGEQNNPELISREILELAKKKCDGKVLDDMTVVVSKLYAC